MADSESDLETEGLDLALETLSNRHCKDDASLNSKRYCSEFCKLVEEYTGQWQVPLPQLKVLRTALCSFTKATAAFPDDCQHIHYVLSSIALSFFELLLFFSKEEYGEEPLKDILDSFLECHSQLLRHRNVCIHHVKQIIKTGGPWESPVLQGILKETVIPKKQIEDFLSSELPIFLELRLRYLQACERLKEALALSKSCLENGETGNHLFFHQAYLTCLYKASLHEHLLKEMAEIDGRDAVEIICNTESVEKDELLLSLCKAFLTQQLHNGDMYYIWDLVFIWSRLYLRAHPSRQEFLSECLQLASSATNVRAIFPFIKLVNTEFAEDCIQVCVELCARALDLCDLHSDTVTRSLVCKTIAFLLPQDLEICRACALLVFCQERSLEAYRTVCLLYMHPDDELHPCNSPLRTCVRFHILQKLKERLCFDPEFWNLLTLRTHCLELISDKAMQAAVLKEVEEEKKFCEEMSMYICVNEHTTGVTEDPPESSKTVSTKVENIDEEKLKPLTQSENVPKRKRRHWTRRPQIQKTLVADAEVLPAEDDPEVVYYNAKPNFAGKTTMYSLRRNHKNRENAAPGKFPFNRKREYLTRSVKSQILKRKGHKKRWLQEVQTLDSEEAAKVRKILYRGKKRGRKPLTRFELSYPDNEIHLKLECDNKADACEIVSKPQAIQDEDIDDDKNNAVEMEKYCSAEETPMETHIETSLPKEDLIPAVEADPELDGPPLDLADSVLEIFHNYCLNSSPTAEGDDGEEAAKAEESTEESTAESGKEKTETETPVTTEETKPEVKEKKTWKEKMLQTQKYSQISFSCKPCHKDYKGLNVLRHALSHVNKKRRRCILCGKRIEPFSLAKKHIMDHIEEMVKQKSHNDVQQAEKDNETPTTNGIENQTSDENQKEASVTNEETKEIKRKTSRHKKLELTKEERILRNLRFIVKKTVLLHKNNSKDDTNAEIDFRDDQVVIDDGLVILKLPLIQADGGNEKIDTALKNEADKVEVIGNICTKKEEERKKSPVMKNCQGGGELVYYLCPAEMCDKVFLQQGTTLMRHAVKYHLNEDKVLDKVFTWSKQKCVMCFRHLQYLQHYKDHVRLHIAQLQFFCYHQDCDQRFATLQDLRSHESMHTPFRPQCPYTACESLFQNIQSLYDHEWRHYVPAPQKLDGTAGSNKFIRQNTEAPWKQRVKVEELWLQNKSPREEMPSVEADTSILNSSEESMSIVCDDLDQVHSEEANADAKTNGFENEDKKDEVSHSSEQIPPKGRKKKERPVRDPLDVKDHVDLTVLSSGSTKKLSEVVIAEHKTFKPDGSAPFMRPPPCMYMKESELSMPKRKAAEEEPPKPVIRKYTIWNRHKLQFNNPAETAPEPAPELKTRHRCQKCLSSFGTEEEFEKHKTQNTCSALFGFDSDDES